MEVVLSVNNGLVEIIASTTIEVVNATLGVDSNDRKKLISESRYFDLLGQRIYRQKIGLNQLYIEQEIYIDGSHNFFKRLSY
jgi:restriction endonuclease Mrr